MAQDLKHKGGGTHTPRVSEPAPHFARRDRPFEQSARDRDTLRTRQIMGWWILPSCSLGLVFWVALARWLFF